MLQCITVNITSHGNLDTVLLACRAAGYHIVFIQEHKLKGGARHMAMHRLCQAGLPAHLNEALPGQANSPHHHSGGFGIAWLNGAAMLGAWEDLIPGRAVGGRMSIPGGTILRVVSCYGESANPKAATAQIEQVHNTLGDEGHDFVMGVTST
jgi:hypothetical protein